MLTGHAAVEFAIEGMKLCDFDHLMAPCEIEQRMAKVLEAARKKRDHEEKIREAGVRVALTMHGLE